MSENDNPSWGKTIGVFFLCLLATGFACAIVALALSYSIGQGGYGVGGILSWICAFICASIYRSNGNVGRAIAIAVVVGVVLGAVTALAGPALYQMRYGR